MERNARFNRDRGPHGHGHGQKETGRDGIMGWEREQKRRIELNRIDAWDEMTWLSWHSICFLLLSFRRNREWE